MDYTSIGLRRTMNAPRREELAASAASSSSFGSALLSLRKDAPTKASISTRRTISTNATASLAPIGGLSRPATSSSNMQRKPAVPLNHTLRERNSTMADTRKPIQAPRRRGSENTRVVNNIPNRVLMNQEKEPMPSPPMLKSRIGAHGEKVLDILDEEQQVEAGELDEVTLGSTKQTADELPQSDELKKEITKLSESNAHLSSEIVELRASLGQLEKTSMERAKQLEEEVISERQQKQNALDTLVSESETYRGAMQELQKQLEASRAELTMQTKRVQEQTQKRASVECMLVAQKERTSAFEMVEEQLVKTKLKLAQKDAAILASLEENRALQQENQRLQALLEIVSKDLSGLKVTQAETLVILNEEKEKVVLQRGYMMCRNMNVE